MTGPQPGASPPFSPQRYLAIPTVKPRLTYVILALNILVFLAGTLTGPDVWFFYGAKVNSALAAGEWWRLVTPMFLHAGLIHIAVNSYSLFVFSPQVEALFGYRRFICLYLLSGISGVVFSFALSASPSVGASGAIFGLVGAMAVYFYRHRQLFGERGRRTLIEIAVIAGVNLLIGLSPGIDNWGHIGGLCGGAVLSWLIGPIYSVKFDPATNTAAVTDTNPLRGQRWLAVFAIALILAAATTVIATFQR